MIAQLTPEMVKGIWPFLMYCGAVLFLLNQGSEFIKGFMPKRSHPPNEQLQRSHDDLERRVGVLEVDLKKDREGNGIHISQRSSTIYKKIDEVTGELREDMKAQSDRCDMQIDELRKEISTLPERLLNMIRNIRELGGAQ
jgi:hypothetical protein